MTESSRAGMSKPCRQLESLLFSSLGRNPAWNRWEVFWKMQTSLKSLISLFCGCSVHIGISFGIIDMLTIQCGKKHLFLCIVRKYYLNMTNIPTLIVNMIRFSVALFYGTWNREQSMMKSGKHNHEKLFHIFTRQHE